MRRIAAAILFAVAAAPGFAGQVFVNPAFAGPAEDMIAADRAFSAMSVEKGRHAAFLAYMADNVRLFDGPSPPLVGKAAVAAHYAEQEKSPAYAKNAVLAWEPIEAEASPDGVLGFTRGRWTFTNTDAEGKDVKVAGYYTTIWRRQADGQYKFVLDIGGTDSKAE